MPRKRKTPRLKRAAGKGRSAKTALTPGKMTLFVGTNFESVVANIVRKIRAIKREERLPVRRDRRASKWGGIIEAATDRFSVRMACSLALNSAEIREAGKRRGIMKLLMGHVVKGRRGTVFRRIDSLKELEGTKKSIGELIGDEVKLENFWKGFVDNFLVLREEFVQLGLTRLESFRL